ncbi:hypothetical protein FLACOL_01504 [Flavobacterium columnare]|uniref:Uncharacterized protein n=2 Tax=Flavobacterium TaxID=237 RepID=A0A246GJD3_9FLAO|nr:MULTISPECIES: hypothetical protein [Flavobacterium]OWP84395.1 hypothetical protein BWK59_05560 [Flavobacterium davisii]SPE77509.1 hypothetical protein FLACOL_01504 [Flavobacterium columnare]
MKKYKASGVIFDTSPKILNEILIRIYPKIKSKARIFGYDFEYIDEIVEFFINTTDEKEYYLHIDFNGEYKEMNDLMLKLEKMLLENAILFDIGFYEKDINGNQISNDINFTHPNFGNKLN